MAKNTSDFTAAVVGMADALAMGRRDLIVAVRGDSVTALSWAEEEQFRTWRASSASVVFAQVAAAGKLDCIGTHIEAARIDEADKALAAGGVDSGADGARVLRASLGEGLRASLSSSAGAERP